MKITIDTKEDSHEDIRKIIGLLQNMVSQSSSSQQDIFSTSPSPDSSAQPSSFFNMFGDTPLPAQENTLSPTSSQEDEEPEIKQEDIPEVIPY